MIDQTKNDSINVGDTSHVLTEDSLEILKKFSEIPGKWVPEAEINSALANSLYLSYDAHRQAYRLSDAGYVLLNSLGLLGQVLKSICAIVKGAIDEKHWKIIWDYYYPNLKYIVLKSAVNETDTQEILQNTFTKFYEKRALLASKEGFDGFLKGRLYLEKNAYFRRKKEFLVNSDTEMNRPPEDRDSASDEEDHILEDIYIQQIFSELTKQLQNTAFLFWHHDLPQKEIAKIMKISLKAVQQNIYRAKIALKKIIEKKSSLSDTRSKHEEK